LADRVVELAATTLAGLPEARAFPDTSGAEVSAAFESPLPEDGLGPAALDALTRVVALSRPPGPRFFGYVLGSGEPVAALADLLASVLNQNVTAWRSAPAAVTVERVVVRWLAEAVGCPGFVGSLTGGGSAANLMALAMARESRAPANAGGVHPGGVIYASSEVHMSVPRAAALLGLGHSAVRHVPVDASFRMDVGELERAVEQDILAGRRPIAVVASAGTVNTGAIDPLRSIADVARRQRLWMHVDGAYGGLAALAVPEAFQGMDLADSVSLDAHKWLYQPLDCGCLLYRDARAAQAAFSHTGDYTRSLLEDPVERFAFFEESLELSRRFRALKPWLSLRYHGVRAYRESIRIDLALAQRLAASIDARPELERLAPVPLSAVCFRHRGLGAGRSAEELDRFNQELLLRVVRRGRVFLSNATVRGRFALRACLVNHRSTEADVDSVVGEVLAAAAG
ncbi:MAG TPA: pyridoxal-dependent decarboxylase, partial [Myxococcaceae bacterium]|nr:pyridoxal-dependent decarboxylase [Myxococcaceae bacterium]